MLRILAPKELFSPLMRRTPTSFGTLVIMLACFLALSLPAFGQCTAPSFAAATNFAAGAGPELMAVGDFNGDGKGDLAVPDFNADSVTILLGNGAGSFTPGGSYPVGHQPTSAAAGDFNRDGKLDLAVVNYSSFGFGDMSILIGTGTGSFGAPTSYRVLAFNNSVTVSDLNNDGKLDIVAGTYSEGLGMVKVLMGDGAGGFSPMTGFGGTGDGYSAVVGDFNGDGKGDVAIAKYDEIDGTVVSNIEVLLGDGTGRLGAATDFTVGKGPVAIAVGDLNGDGKLDLAVANVESDNVSVLLGNGAGGFGAAANLAVGDGANSVAVGDFNGDGKPDLAVSSALSDTVSILVGDGTGGFSAPANFAVGTRPISVVVSDFNGDNKSDLAIANFDSDNVSILLNSCSGVPVSNPIDDAQFFVRQHYLDFLSRNPDQTGLDYWTSQITNCVADALCIHNRRVVVSDAFFFEPEFNLTGGYVYRIYKAAFGINPTFAQFQPDRAQVVGGANLDQAKTAFALNFVQRPAFVSAYPVNMMAQEFVDKMALTIQQNSQVDLSSLKPSLLPLYDGTDNGRAAILRQVADNQQLIDGEYNRLFVLDEYFAYLRRDAEPDGYNFWLGQVNRFPLRDVDIQHAMVCSFITSAEYQLRFGTSVTHTNQECPQ